MARASSPASTGSMASNITVDVDGHSETRSTIVVSATPLTGLDVAGSTDSLAQTTSSRVVKVSAAAAGNTGDGSPAEDTSRRRSGRARHSLSTYNLNVLSGTAKNMPRPSSRNVSGDTLVDDSGVETTAAGSLLKAKKSSASLNLRPLLSDGIRALDLDWRVDALPGDPARSSKAGSMNNRRSSRLGSLASRVEKATVVAGSRIKEVASALGKRGREALNTGVGGTEEIEGQSRKRSKIAMAESIATPAKSDSVDLDAPIPRKKYLSAGLYAGMNHGFDPRLTEEKNKTLQQKKLANSDLDGEMKVMQTNKLLPLPMFSGERLLDIGRPFKLPWDVFSPLPKACKPEEWKKTSRNYFIDDASSLWKKTAPLPMSRCACPTPPEDSLERGCGDNCHNRHMMYECDDTNCRLGETCSNRSYSDLKRRVKKGNPYDIGVEVVKTEKRGYGVRSMRGFEPGQIIVEYTGEIVTLEEMERRMNVDYKDNDCYYMMEFHNGMYIDATRGSIARFVNHSCEPNCEMVKWVVAGQPRMALFAGEKGIVTGEELTYDYNFQNFAKTHQQACYCGAPSCRRVLGPRSKEPAAKREASTSGAKRKLAAAVSRLALGAGRSKAGAARTAASVTTRDADGFDEYEFPPAKRHKPISKKAKSLLARANSLKVGKRSIGQSSNSLSTNTRIKSTKTHQGGNEKVTKAGSNSRSVATTTARHTKVREVSASTTASSRSSTALLLKRSASTSTSASRRTNISTPPSSTSQPSSSTFVVDRKKLVPASRNSGMGKHNLQQMRETMRRFLQAEKSTAGDKGSDEAGGKTSAGPTTTSSSARIAAAGVVRTIRKRRESVVRETVRSAAAVVGKKSVRVVAMD